MTIQALTSASRPAGVIDGMMDHLVYATDDLPRTLTDFTEITGVAPVPGGRHLGKGTRNYLVGLGVDRYLELIGPDPENPADPGVQTPFGIDRIDRPVLLTWAVHPADPDLTLAAAQGVGVELGELVPMHRLTADGATLSWRLASSVPLPFAGVVPFLIDWGTTPHPAASELPQVELVSFTGRQPESAQLRAALLAMDIELAVKQGEPGLQAVLRTPNGTVLLS